MSNLLSYKNYNGTVEYSKEYNCLFGKVIGIKSSLSYEGDSIKELEQNFQNVIDNYLEDCKEREVEPDQPYRKAIKAKERLRYEYSGFSDFILWWIDVTDLVQEVMGCIVKNAEVSGFLGCEEDEVIKATKKFIKKQEWLLENKSCIDFNSSIEFNLGSLVITFTNGRKIEIPRAKFIRR